MVVLKFGGSPTHNRPEMYHEMLTNVLPQVDKFVTVTHGPEANQYATGPTIPFNKPVANLAIQWNMILDWAHNQADGEPYYVAVFNDDVLVADDWFDRMIETMKRENTVGASTPRFPDWPQTIFGAAWAVKGSAGFRMSGVAEWYYTDDEVQRWCMQNGGFSIVNNVHTVNRLANQSTIASDDLRRISKRDKPHFIAQYGGRVPKNSHPHVHPL